MITVSTDYLAAVYAPSRAVTGKVIFQIVDVTAMSDASVAVTSEASISHKDQIFDTVTEMTGKYATLEDNYWKLDGSYSLPPKSTEIGYQVGWWSNTMCGSDGVFDTPQVVTITFTGDHDSIGLSIFFDVLTDEYAKDFVITVYDSADAVIHTETVTNNTLAKYILSQNLPDYRKIILTITKWAVGYRRARVNEISFGIVEEYTGNELISVNVMEDISTTSDTTSTDELTFTLDNSDKTFNILNPSGVYNYLQRKQKIIPYFGVMKANLLYEYVPMGIFYLTEWKSDQGSLTATFTARDVLDILGQSVYRKGKQQSRTLYDLAIDVLTDAGVTDYTIDSALNSITSTGNIPLMTHREALQLIAIAGKAVCYSDRYGDVVIKQLSNTPTTQTIDFDNVYNSPQITLDKLVNTIELSVSNYVARGSSEEIYNGSLTISGTMNVWIEFKEFPCQTISSIVTGGTLNTETYYGNAGVLNITASGVVTITTTGTVLEKSDSIYSLLDSTAPAGEQTISIKIDNPLVTSNAIAYDVATWILAEHKKRFIYDINWRGAPHLECGDIVTVEDEFSEDKLVRLTKNQFDFAGSLSAKTGGKGGS